VHPLWPVHAASFPELHKKHSRGDLFPSPHHDYIQLKSRLVDKAEFSSHPRLEPLLSTPQHSSQWYRHFRFSPQTLAWCDITFAERMSIQE